MQASEDSSPFLRGVREAIRVRHFSIRTEEAYVQWVKRFILFHRKRHPAELGEEEVAAFLTHLAVDGRVAPATQNQALNALVFLYRNVLARPLGECTGIVRAKRPPRLPVVLTAVEVGRVLAKPQGVYWLIGCLQYGSGLRLLESVRLRVKDLDFDHCAIFVRDGKGAKDRVVTLPDELVVPLKRHLANRKTVFERDRANGVGTVYLPYALARKYPCAESEWGGSMYSWPIGRASTRARGNVGATTWTRAAFRERSAWRCASRRFTSRRAATRFAIRSQPTCWNVAQTYELFRSSSATRMCARRRFIRTSSNAVAWL